MSFSGVPSFGRMVGFAGAPWVPLPDGVTVGDSTAWPFGLTPSQLIDFYVNVNSLHINCSFGSGSTATPAPVPTIFGTNIQHKIAGVFGTNNLTTITSDGLGGGVTFTTAGTVGLNMCYWNPADGLFYPNIDVGYEDDNNAGGSTLVTGGSGPSPCATAIFYGVTVNVYPSNFPAIPASTTITITPDGYFP